MEDPVNAVFVIRRCEDVGNDELAPSSDDDRVITEIRVLEKNTCIFFMNANSVLDGCTFSRSVDESGVLKW